MMGGGHTESAEGGGEAGAHVVVEAAAALLVLVELQRVEARVDRRAINDAARTGRTVNRNLGVFVAELVGQDLDVVVGSSTSVR